MRPYTYKALFFALGALSSCLVAAQQTMPAYPSKPVRVVVALAPGGGTDIQARMFAQKLSENLGQQFIVDNRPGAGGTIGYALIAKAPADGYTVLAAASGFAITPAFYTNLPYDPIKDFAPISLATEAPFWLLVNPSVPVKSTKELIAIARTGTLNFGSAGNGSSTHLSLELFKLLTKCDISHIPYKSTGESLTAAIGGQVHGVFANILSSIAHVKNGRLRALAITSAQRSSVVPTILTLDESGVAGYVMTAWHGWLAPAKTPPAILNRLSVELTKVVKSADIAQKLAEDGGEPVGSAPAQFGQHISQELSRYRDIVKRGGLRID